MQFVERPRLESDILGFSPEEKAREWSKAHDCIRGRLIARSLMYTQGVAC